MPSTAYGSPRPPCTPGWPAGPTWWWDAGTTASSTCRSRLSLRAQPGGARRRPVAQRPGVDRPADLDGLSRPVDVRVGGWCVVTVRRAVEPTGGAPATSGCSPCARLLWPSPPPTSGRSPSTTRPGGTGRGVGAVPGRDRRRPVVGTATGFPDPDTVGTVHLVAMFVAGPGAVRGSVSGWSRPSSQARTDGADRVLLHVVETNPTPSGFYARCGFVRTGGPFACRTAPTCSSTRWCCR